MHVEELMIDKVKSKEKLNKMNSFEQQRPLSSKNST